jgi:hypothetical protein
MTSIPFQKRPEGRRRRRRKGGIYRETFLRT